jgi:hypothetical protein
VIASGACKYRETCTVAAEGIQLRPADRLPHRQGEGCRRRDWPPPSARSRNAALDEAVLSAGRAARSTSPFGGRRPPKREKGWKKPSGKVKIAFNRICTFMLHRDIGP